MKLGFIGVGVVGGAIYRFFKKNGVECYAYDKFKREEFDQLSEVLTSDIIFVSVPTATRKNGEQDLGPLSEVLSMLSEAECKARVVVKCTVLPGTMDALDAAHGNLRLVHSPEFLTAANPDLDFETSHAHLFSSSNRSSLVDVAMFFDNYFQGTSIFMSNSFRATEMAKYIHNCFLASKVSFFNDMYEACEKIGVNFDEATKMTAAVGGIGQSHFQVPGPDGQKGFGGMCFPKDTSAWIAFADRNGFQARIVNAAVEGNYTRRNDLE